MSTLPSAGLAASATPSAGQVPSSQSAPGMSPPPETFQEVEGSPLTEDFFPNLSTPSVKTLASFATTPSQFTTKPRLPVEPAPSTTRHLPWPLDSRSKALSEAVDATQSNSSNSVHPSPSTESTPTALVAKRQVEAPAVAGTPAAAQPVDDITTPTEPSGGLTATQIRNARGKESRRKMKEALRQSTAQTEVNSGPSTPMAASSSSYTKGSKVRSVQSVIHSKTVVRREEEKKLRDMQAHQQMLDDKHKAAHEAALKELALHPGDKRFWRPGLDPKHGLNGQLNLWAKMNEPYAEYNRLMTISETKDGCPVRPRMKKEDFIQELLKRRPDDALLETPEPLTESATSSTSVPSPVPQAQEDSDSDGWSDEDFTTWNEKRLRRAQRRNAGL